MINLNNLILIDANTNLDESTVITSLLRSQKIRKPSNKPGNIDILMHFKVIDVMIKY